MGKFVHECSCLSLCAQLNELSYIFPKPVCLRIYIGHAFIFLQVFYGDKNRKFIINTVFSESSYLFKMVDVLFAITDRQTDSVITNHISAT